MREGQFGPLQAMRAEEAKGLVEVKLTGSSTSRQRRNQRTARKEKGANCQHHNPGCNHQPAAQRAPSPIMATSQAGSTRATSSRMMKLNVRCAKLPPSFTRRLQQIQRRGAAGTEHLRLNHKLHTLSYGRRDNRQVARPPDEVRSGAQRRTGSRYCARQQRDTSTVVPG